MSSEDNITPETPPFLKEKGYSIGKRIAGGGFSTVYIASCTQFPGQRLAVKVIDIEKSNQTWNEKALKLEMKIMRVLKHKNVIKLYDAFKTPKFGYIFMNLAVNGSVMGYIEKIQKPLTEPKARKWFRDVTCGLSYLHSKNIAHRDIKPDNFLIDENDTAMLTDFGFACIDVTNTTAKLMKGTACGTTEYQAPEITFLKSGNAYDAKAADLYSMGISLYFMVNNGFPFDKNDKKDLIRRQKAREFVYLNKSLSEDVKNLIHSLLNPDPNRRITVSVLEAKHWLKG